MGITGPDVERLAREATRGWVRVSPSWLHPAIMGHGASGSEEPAGNWDEVKDAFEGGASIGSLSRLYGVSRTAIQKRIAKKGWSVTGMTAEEAEEQIQARAHAKAMGIDLEADRETQTQQVDKAAQGRQELIQRRHEMGCRRPHA